MAIMARHIEPDYSDDDDYEFDEEYFARTYQPLSNLPTPPPSSRDSLAAQSPKSLLEDGGLADSALLGPAIHLVNLIPPAASLAQPSVGLVHEILVRADLPLETIGLAVCILDSLSSRFSLNWRLLCPLQQRDLESAEPSKRHTLSAASPTPGPGKGSTGIGALPGLGMDANPAENQLHIDCVNPEVIILASMIIAVKFVSDRHASVHYYRSAWGKDIWSCDQINFTERCIMESLDYRILPLLDPDLIADAVNDMSRAGQQALHPFGSGNASNPSSAKAGPLQSHARSVSAGDATGALRSSRGRAVCGLGRQVTPTETPVSENVVVHKRPTVGVAAGAAGDRGGGGGEGGLMITTFAPSLTRDCLRFNSPRAKRKRGFNGDFTAT